MPLAVVVATLSACGIDTGSAGGKKIYHYYGYATNGGDGLSLPGSNTITVFSFLPDKGTSLPVENHPCGNTPIAAAVDPLGRFLYVANLAGNTVSTFGIDVTTGSLKDIGDFSTGVAPRSVAVHPSGNFVYVVNSDPGSNSVSAFTVSAAGTLGDNGSYIVGASPYQAVMDPLGAFLYVVNYAGSSISIFSIDASTGLLTLVDTQSNGANTLPFPIALAPNGKFLYAVNGTGGTINRYSVNSSTGKLTLLGTDRPPSAPFRMMIEPRSQYAYITFPAPQGGASSNNVSQLGIFSVSPTDGTLTFLSQVNGGVQSVQAVVDPTDQYLLLPDQGQGNNISLFSIGSAGKLNSPTFLPADQGPNSLVFASVIQPR